MAPSCPLSPAGPSIPTLRLLGLALVSSSLLPTQLVPQPHGRPRQSSIPPAWLLLLQRPRREATAPAEARLGRGGAWTPSHFPVPQSEAFKDLSPAALGWIPWNLSSCRGCQVRRIRIQAAGRRPRGLQTHPGVGAARAPGWGTRGAGVGCGSLGAGGGRLYRELSPGAAAGAEVTWGDLSAAQDPLRAARALGCPQGPAGGGTGQRATRVRAPHGTGRPGPLSVQTKAPADARAPIGAPRPPPPPPPAAPEAGRSCTGSRASLPPAMAARPCAGAPSAALHGAAPAQPPGAARSHGAL